MCGAERKVPKERDVERKTIERTEGGDGVGGTASISILVVRRGVETKGRRLETY